VKLTITFVLITMSAIYLCRWHTVSYRRRNLWTVYHRHY